jgi:hypothetical protein
MKAIFLATIETRSVPNPQKAQRRSARLCSGWASDKLGKRKVLTLLGYGLGALPELIPGLAVREIVASNRNGVGCGRCTHIHGFSENVIRYIQEIEARG